MNKTFLKPMLMLAALLLIAANACAHPSSKSAPKQPAQADTIEVMSQKMARNIKNVVIVPEEYYDDDMQDTRYPVLYLLHGATGCYSDWSKKTDLNVLASRYGMIIVCPDGQDSWYYDSPVDSTMQFETYVSKELVEYIDNNYRTYAHRFMRAITGLSMGGHGALFLAFRHPDVFWSCGSMSGNMDITNYPDRWHLKDRLGNLDGNEQRWRDHTIINMVDLVKNSNFRPAQNIMIDDGLNDIFIKNNIALHDKLVEKGINHDFIVRPGRHSWDYWVNSLDYHMLFFDKAFKRAVKLMEKDLEPEPASKITKISKKL